MHCDACGTDVDPWRKSTIDDHRLALSHQQAVKEKQKSHNVATTLAAHVATLIPHAATRPPEQVVHRLAALEVFLRTNTPLDRLPAFKSIIKDKWRITGDPHTLIPMLRGFHMDNINTLLQDRDFLVSFDATSDPEEVLAVALRFVDDHFRPRQLLVRLGVYGVPFEHKSLAAELYHILFEMYSLQPKRLKAFVCDGGPVNPPAIDMLRVSCKCFEEIYCISHFLDNVGKKTSIPELNSFLEQLSALFSQLWARKKLLDYQKELADIPFTSLPPNVSRTRWWSRYEQMRWVLFHWSDVVR